MRGIIFGILIVAVLVLLAYFHIFNVADTVKPYFTGPPGKDGKDGKDADIGVLKNTTLWCDTDYCTPPAGKKRFQVGTQRLHFDDDKVLRHTGTTNSHDDVAFATGTLYVTKDAKVYNSLRIGNHTIISAGNELRIFVDGGKHVSLYSDPSHSSIKTQRSNGTDNWFGY